MTTKQLRDKAAELLSSTTDSQILEQVVSILSGAADLPDWHKKALDKRMKLYEQDESNVLDFDKAMDEIEESL